MISEILAMSTTPTPPRVRGGAGGLAGGIGQVTNVQESDGVVYLGEVVGGDVYIRNLQIESGPCGDFQGAPIPQYPTEPIPPNYGPYPTPWPTPPPIGAGNVVEDEERVLDEDGPPDEPVDPFFDRSNSDPWDRPIWPKDAPDCPSDMTPCADGTCDITRGLVAPCATKGGVHPSLMIVDPMPHELQPDSGLEEEYQSMEVIETEAPLDSRTPPLGFTQPNGISVTEDDIWRFDHANETVNVPIYGPPEQGPTKWAVIYWMELGSFFETLYAYNDDEHNAGLMSSAVNSGMELYNYYQDYPWRNVAGTEGQPLLIFWKAVSEGWSPRVAPNMNAGGGAQQSGGRADEFDPRRLCMQLAGSLCYGGSSSQLVFANNDCSYTDPRSLAMDAEIKTDPCDQKGFNGVPLGHIINVPECPKDAQELARFCTTNPYHPCCPQGKSYFSGSGPYANKGIGFSDTNTFSIPKDKYPIWYEQVNSRPYR